METAAAGEGVDGLQHGAAGSRDRGKGRLDVLGVENRQRLWRRLPRLGLKAALQTLVEGRIGRSVVGERPAECGAVERLHAVERAAPGGQFQIVELACLTHRKHPLIIASRSWYVLDIPTARATAAKAFRSVLSCLAA